jgi:hypothetical protein
MTSASSIPLLRRAALPAALALCALLAGQAGAIIAPTINYQGFLLSKVTNEPVDTPQDLKFAIYNTATGGAPLFTENRCNLRVSKGRYDVEIGSSSSGGVPGDLFMDYTALWLEIQVDSDNDCAGAYEPMTPRVKLQASPYAFNSLYASTASAATSNFRADIISALPNTTYGAITISTNLFVQGGISVGSISPGQKLAVAGVVESTGNWPSCATAPDYTCGFKFPDGSVQVKAAALTMWDVLGLNLYTINEGNTNIGGNLTVPSARLHISSAAGDSGPLLLVSTGTGLVQSQLFLVNGNGQVYGNSFHGDGSTLSNIVRRAGDNMTGPLTMAASSFTVTSALGATTPKLRFAQGVEISSAPASVRGGIIITSHVYLSPGATYYGDGSGLINVTTLDQTKVLKSGDVMTGPLTLANSTLTVTGDAFSVTGSTFSIFGGSVAVGGDTYPVRLSVTGGILATSSITAQAGLFSDTLRVSSLGQFYNVTAATATFWSWDTQGAGYTIDTASGIKVRAGIVDAPYFVGNGSLLTGVLGTDAARVLKAGDTMTGNLLLAGSSVTIADNGAHSYALTVATAVSVNNYSLAVTTGGRVGVQVNNPAAPLDVYEQALISNPNGSAHLDFSAFGGYTYLRWSDTSLMTNGSAQGALGYPLATRDLVYRAMGSDPVSGGQEVFRIKSDDNAYWQFGVGTNSPTERFHVAGNVLVSTAAASPIFFVSTATNRVGIRTLAPAHALDVNGGIRAISSITAQGGFFGDGAGITNLSPSSFPAELRIATITAVAGGYYDGIVFSTSVYVQNKLAVGDLFAPQAELHLRGVLRLDNKGFEDVIINMFPETAGSAYIRWNEGATTTKGVLGMVAGSRDLVYRGGASALADGVQAFRIKPTGEFIVGGAVEAFVPAAPLHVLSNFAVAAAGQAPVFFISTGSLSVGISTGSPKERAHVGSSFLVGGDRASAALYVSTQSGYTGVGTGSPAARLDVNGLGVFRSSLTVSGTGLSGTQTAFGVLGSTLIVRNDGRIGIGSAVPDATLDVNGSAQFGSGVTKSSVTAGGFFVPRAMTSADLQLLTPAALGAMVYNSDIANICFSTGTAAPGQWAVAGTKGDCF